MLPPATVGGWAFRPMGDIPSLLCVSRWMRRFGWFCAFSVGHRIFGRPDIHKSDNWRGSQQRFPPSFPYGWRARPGNALGVAWNREGGRRSYFAEWSFSLGRISPRRTSDLVTSLLSNRLPVALRKEGQVACIVEPPIELYRHLK